MMQHNGGMMPPQAMGGMPPQQVPGGPPPPPQPQQWGVIPPPMPQQYSQPPPQQPPAIWNQPAPSQIQPPAPYGHQPQQQQQYYGGQAQAPSPGSGDVRTLWIGDLQFWMDENYIYGCFAHTGEVLSVKLIRDKGTGQLQGYGFIEFASRSTAEQVLQTYNGQMMPNVEQAFRLNWASAGEKRDDSPDYTIFVGDLASDVTDYMLQETFRSHYPSVKGAKVVTDKLTGRSKGYGFVKFGDPVEQTRAMTEMNGQFCSSRPMRIGAAANKKTVIAQEKAPSIQGSQTESDPNNTTIFVGGLDPSVPEETLRQLFSTYGEVVHVKIPVGKRCGFVQFANRSSAEEALLMLQGSILGGQSIRLSWGRSPNKQPQQQDATQSWNNSYYGYGQHGYDAYGYAQQSQDPNAYAYGGYQGYPNYQQSSQGQQPQQQ